MREALRPRGKADIALRPAQGGNPPPAMNAPFPSGRVEIGAGMKGDSATKAAGAAILRVFDAPGLRVDDDHFVLLILGRRIAQVDHRLNLLNAGGHVRAGEAGGDA